MIEALLTTVHPTSRDGTHALIASFLNHHPASTVHVVDASETDLAGLPASVTSVEQVEKRCELPLRDTLDPENQLLFSLPFVLEDILRAHSRVAYISPGCLVVRPLADLADLLRGNRLAVASPAVPSERFSETPHLPTPGKPRELISHRVLGIRQDGAELTAAWQEAMIETFFDVQQRLPNQTLPLLMGEFLGEEGVGVSRGETVTSWVDYAAVESGRAVGPRAAVVVCDELWGLGRDEVAGERDTVQVDWQFLGDKVHDSRPLEPLLESIRRAVLTCPIDDRLDPSPLDLFTREVRRAADPLGLRWGPAEDAGYHAWLFERNPYGLTRLAHLYWLQRPDLWEDIPDPKLDPAPLAEWGAEHSSELGGDLFDPSRPEKALGNTEAWAEHPALGRVRHALAWRINILKGLVPGYPAWRSRRELAREDPGVRRGLAPPKRIEVRRAAPLYGSSPRRLTVFGGFRAESGLGQAARGVIQALHHTGRQFSFIDTSEEYYSRNAADPGLGEAAFGAFGDVNLVHSNADELITLGDRVFRNRLAGRFNIGMWAWEAADLPAASRPAFGIVDELWVASNYLADVFGQYGKVPVKVIGHPPPQLPEAIDTGRAAFGLPDDEFVFLFVYDALSAHGRKNPEKTLEAFVRAFAPDFRNVRFVLKVSNLNKFPVSQRRILAMAERYPSITVINEYWPRSRVLELMAVADVYVSLHAAEGFGLTLVESMALGTPVICTGYSGNMDFTTPENSWLVDYRMMATEEPTGPYPAGSVWAAPDVDDAAELMRVARQNPTEMERKRRQAMLDAREIASLEGYAAQLEAELQRVLGS